MNLNQLPADLAQFMQQEVAEGKYPSTEEVVSAALRLLQEHEAQGHHGGQTPNGSPDANSHSAAGVMQTITNALASGQHGLARQLAMDGAKQYPDHEGLQTFGRILAPPTVGKPMPTTLEQRAARKANKAWLKAHRQLYRGNWIALRSGELLHSSPSFDEVIEQVGNVRGRNILLTKIA